jgi:cytochrome c-type biogenesis protein CcsB
MPSKKEHKMYKNFDIFLGNFSFLILFISMLIYWTQFDEGLFEQQSCSNRPSSKTPNLETKNKKDSFSKTNGFRCESETRLNLLQKLNFIFNNGYRARTIATISTMIANMSLFLLLILRWKESGHFPLSNLYESLMFLSWSLTSIHLFIEIGFSSYIPARIYMPKASGAYTGGLLQRSSPPASLPVCKPSLSASLLRYPGLEVIRDVSSHPFEGITTPQGDPRSGDNILLQNKGHFTTSMLQQNETHTQPDVLHNNQHNGQSSLIIDQRKAFIASRLIGSITAPSALFTNAFATFSLPKEMQEAAPLVPALQSNWLMMHVTVMILSYAALILGSLLSIGFLVITSGNNTNWPLSNKISYRLNLAKTLDNLSYRVLGLGFPLLTIGILSGAVWANEAWGSYWSWDPKETWALLTWLVFAIYLHTRLTKGWEGKKPALIASLGFVTVWICFLGVNLIGEGLHSYGWIAQ